MQAPVPLLCLSLIAVSVGDGSEQESPEFGGGY